jgi:hypothetical protein
MLKQAKNQAILILMGKRLHLYLPHGNTAIYQPLPKTMFKVRHGLALYTPKIGFYIPVSSRWSVTWLKYFEL